MSITVLTRRHYDHIMGTGALIRRVPATVCMNSADEFLICDSEWNAVNFSKIGPIEVFAVDRYLKDGDILTLGENEVKVLETPGHTPGETALNIERHLFCGDTILRGTTGRMDLLGAAFPLAAKSIEEKIFILPDDTIIHCGPGEESTVGYEKANNDTVKPT